MAMHLARFRTTRWACLPDPCPLLMSPLPPSCHSVIGTGVSDTRLLVQWRFALLCLAALEAPLQLPLHGTLYGTDMVFIANDWQAALTPVYLAGKYRPFGVYHDARCVVAIHNLRHQARLLISLRLIQCLLAPSGAGL